MDFSSMNMIAFFVALGLYILVIALDVVISWLDNALSIWLNYGNIVLHIAFLLSLMFVGVDIEIPVLAFMISLFSYSLSSYINYEYKKRRLEAITVVNEEVDNTGDKAGEQISEDLVEQSAVASTLEGEPIEQKAEEGIV